MLSRESVASSLPFEGRIVETSEGLYTATVTDVRDHSDDAFRVDLEFKRGAFTEAGALLLFKRRLGQTPTDDELAALLRYAFKTRRTPPTDPI
jgi:hypothetical protein